MTDLLLQLLSPLNLAQGLTKVKLEAHYQEIVEVKEQTKLEELIALYIWPNSFFFSRLFGKKKRRRKSK